VWLVPGQDTRVTHDITGNREVHAPCELAPARVRKYQSPTSRLAERPTSYWRRALRGRGGRLPSAREEVPWTWNLHQHRALQGEL